MLRGTALAFFALILIVGPLVGERASTFDQLEGGLYRGDVSSVRIEGHTVRADGTPTPIEVGDVEYRLVWREGMVTEFTNVRQLVGDPNQVSTARQTFTEPIEDVLREANPAVRITYAQPRTSWATIGNYEAPVVFGLLPLATGLLWLIVLMNGPEPRLATRWAWFWITFSPIALVAAPAYLVIGAQGAKPGALRLTGGWAFLISIFFLGGIGFANS
ncbi:hypothetical protein ACQBAT_14345 [Ornithinimicrobium sp. Y1847]|uniref:hypothetical protein n=1 Tax=Ornithinimicrobium sp. Y1847 TaxID=3405419 RepID=UPI003B671793